MNEDVEAGVVLVKKEWQEAISELRERILEIETCGCKGGARERANLPRLNAVVQDRFGTLQSLSMKLEFLAQQLPSEEESEACIQKLQEWKDQYQALRLSIRSANIKAKSNIEKATKEERDLLLAGGEEATSRRRNLQTQAGMVSASENITEGLRRTRQLMAQEVDRSANTIQTLDQSNITLRNAKDEYDAHRSILSRTRNLLTSMGRQDVIDRVILVVAVTIFFCVCNYILQKRLRFLKLNRTSPPIFSIQPVTIPQPAPSLSVAKTDNAFTVHEEL